MRNHKGWKSILLLILLILAFGVVCGGVSVRWTVIRLSDRPAVLEAFAYESDGMEIVRIILFAFSSLVCVLFAVWLLYELFTGYSRAIKRFHAEMQKPLLQEKIDTFFGSTEELLKGIRINKEFVFLHCLSLNQYLNYSANITKAFKFETRIKNKYGKDKFNLSVWIEFPNKTYHLPVKDEKSGDNILHLISSYCPDAKVSYHTESQESLAQQMQERLAVLREKHQR